MKKPDFSKADWAQISQRPGQLQQVPGVGPVVFFETGLSEAAARQFVAAAQQQMCRETSLEGLDKKRPMIDRTHIFNAAGRPMSLREATHAEFRDWAITWLKRAGYETVNWGHPDTSPVAREAVLCRMVEDGISPLMLTQ